MKIAIFTSIDEDTNFHIISDLKRFFKKEWSSVDIYNNNLTVDTVKNLKKISKEIDAIVFLIDNAQDGKYFFNLGFSAGFSIYKKPILFVCLDNDNNHPICCHGGLLFHIYDLLGHEESSKEFLNFYFKNDMEEFWISYAKYITLIFNKNFEIGLIQLQDSDIKKNMAYDNLDDFPRKHLDIHVLKNTTNNFSDYHDTIFKKLYPKLYPTVFMKKIFISYSKKDNRYKEALLNHLEGLRGTIITWNDADLLAGEAWDERIKEELEQADIVLYLVSANSIATGYIKNVELPLIKERCESGKCKLVPIIVSACHWTALDFAKMNALPNKGVAVRDKSWGNQDVAWTTVVQQLEKIV
jgi:hypothetical protein